MKVRRLQHVSSPFPDGKQDEVRAFYGGVLDLNEIPVPRSLASGGLVWFSAGPDSLEIHFFPGIPDPQHRRHLCLEVDDLDAARTRLTTAGYETLDATPISKRPRFFCRDPFGNLIEFTTLVGAYLEETART